MAQQAAVNPLADTTAALRSQDFERALRITAEALKQNPQDLRLLALRGMAYSGAGKPALAIASYNQALKLSPDYLPALEGAAQAEYQQSATSAKPYLVRILALRPEDPTANAMLAVIDAHTRDCAGAVEHFQLAQPVLAQRPDALLQYGACLASLNRLPDAIHVFGQALELAPANPVARYNLALAQWNASQPTDALATLDPLVADTSAPEDVLTLAAEIREAQNETQAAIDLLRRAILTYPKDKAAYLQFATLSYKHTSIEVGIDMLNVGLTQLPNEPELYVARGVLVSQSSKPAEAMKDFDTAARLDPKLSFVSAAEGIARSQAHDSAAALATFRAAAKQHPDDALTQYLLAEALSDEGPAPGTPAFAEALAVTRRALKLDPKRLETHDLLASFYVRAGDTPAALAASEAALTLDSNDEQALYCEILALRKGDRKSEVPALVQRLMAARAANASSAKQAKVYRLVEAPDSH